MDNDLYHARILELARDTSTEGRLDAPTASATINNPLCGDRVTIDIIVDGAALSVLGHKVRGCALCKASATLIGAQAPGHDAARLKEIAEAITAMLKNAGPVPDSPWHSLEAFRPVIDHKSRHDCVLLPFQALVEALDQTI